ncbi:hypothetical protein LSAT2_024142 [Lamellibrachia satsuma]|nr:hypothetical protein LSAT2_024142 [Lamellibrachia satsuma]
MLGGGAGMAATLFVQPLDLIKNRMQLSGKFTASSLDVATTCEIEARTNSRLAKEALAACRAMGSARFEIVPQTYHMMNRAPKAKPDRPQPGLPMTAPYVSHQGGHDNKLIPIRLRAAPFNITVVQVYVRTTCYDDEQMEEFYTQLQDIFDRVDKKGTLIIQGEWNAKSESVKDASCHVHIFLEQIMPDALESHTGTVNIVGRTITNLRLADDIDGLAGEEEEIVNLVNRLDETSARYGMKISAEKKTR